MSTFSAQLAEIAARNRARLEEVVALTLEEIAVRVVERSPTGQWIQWSNKMQREHPAISYTPGRFKGSWVYSQGAQITTFPSTPDTTGALSIDRIRPEELFDVHYILNNAPYANVLEAGAHPTIKAWFLHAPNEDGAVLKTALEFSSIVDGAIASIR